MRASSPSWLASTAAPGASWPLLILVVNAVRAQSCPLLLLLLLQVFLQRAAVNLLGSVMDTPDYFWSAPDYLQVGGVT